MTAWPLRLAREADVPAIEALIAISGRNRGDAGGGPLYASFGYASVERYEIAMREGLRLPVVRMTKCMSRV